MANNNSLKNVFNGVQNQASRWFHHITKAADDYKNRQESRRSELHPATHIPPSVPEPDDKTKDLGEGTEGPTSTVDTAAESNESPGKHEPTSKIQKEASPAPEVASEPPVSPDKPATGDGKLSVGTKLGRSVSASPSATRRTQGEFLRVTESSPLVDPSEVLVTTRDVQFAQSVLSPHEELKRADSMVQKALEEKLRIASKIFNIPPESSVSVTVGNASNQSVPKDAKELVVACMQNVDKLIRIVSNQKFTKENIDVQREQQSIHNSLNGLLNQILGEVARKEEELELRRQELLRIREQNHGYQERLQSRSKGAEKQVSPGNLSSPTLSPPHSRPSSFLSVSSSSDPQELHPEEEAEVVMRIPLKPQLSVPVATSSSNATTTTKPIVDDNCLTHPPDSAEGSHRSSSDLPEEFADAVEDLGITESCEESSLETNRESTETEVVVVVTSTNNLSDATNNVTEVKDGSNQRDVPEVKTNGTGDLTNGHPESVSVAVPPGDENSHEQTQPRPVNGLCSEPKNSSKDEELVVENKNGKCADDPA